MTARESGSRNQVRGRGKRAGTRPDSAESGITGRDMREGTVRNGIDGRDSRVNCRDFRNGGFSAAGNSSGVMPPAPGAESFLLKIVVPLLIILVFAAVAGGIFLIGSGINKGNVAAGADSPAETGPGTSPVTEAGTESESGTVPETGAGTAAGTEQETGSGNDTGGISLPENSSGVAYHIGSLANAALVPITKYATDLPPGAYTVYVSDVDHDGDGIDDQTDILRSAKAYLDTNPKYENRFYEGGWPDDGCGVCTDVVNYALLGAGYDLRELMNDDIRKDFYGYGIMQREKDIDFRRVENQYHYFNRTADIMTLDVDEKEEWQGGDIVVFRSDNGSVSHIGVISDRRASDGTPYVLHNGSAEQESYEQNILLKNRDKIAAHFRIS